MKVVSHHDNNNETIIQKVWLPIGSIYENKNDITEEIKKCFYGTWERYGNGEVLVGVDESDNDFKTPDKSLGEKTHTLSTQELPGMTIVRKSGVKGYGNNNMDNIDGWGNFQNSSTGETVGIGHNNIQPSRTVYRWIRVS